ncbi:hypothetical protein GG681_02775 [Epibacterium sp. SM1969]|uniref:Divergent polysaccharide deacetylase n=1 Tax=Tritonibacter aquimaris TaxID=2663379 RepID=A0A844AJL4_9RHOB|nr:divergent polysaccharide deacetylase family protein [Tritonibacter aquimaris]MQY41550.1 hypothetical protein [Tritonibacter aquimaris]
MRGFLGGVAIGAVVSGMGAALVSLAVPMPRTVDVPQDEPQAIAAPVEASVGEARDEGTASLRDADLVEVPPVVPAPVERGDDLAIPSERAAVERPDVGDAPLELRELESTVAEIALPEGDTPPQPNTLNLPDVPGAEAAPEVETTPAEEPVEEVAALAPEAALEPVTEPVAEPVQGTENLVEQPVDVPEPSVDASVEPSVEPQDPPAIGSVSSSKVAILAPEISAPSSAGLPNVTLPQVVRPVPATREPGAAEEKTAQVTEDPSTETTLRPRVGTPATALVTQGSAEAAVEGAPERSPFERNSEEFILIDSRPLMSIVLLDEPGSLGAEALAEFPYPLSFAIRADDPDAKSKAAARRAAGFEVLMLVDLAREATPKDAEMSMEVWLPKMPEAVGLLEGVDSGFQGTRALADQVAALAESNGLGLVTQANGFNTVQKLAARDGVPAGVVFRDFDGAGQDPRAIRRFLDQAAFRANQEGAVIMLGRLQPDTISALLLWGLQDRASRVQLAPVSASLSTAISEE